MTILQYINENEEQLKLLMTNAMLDGKLFLYRDIYYQYKANCKVNKTYQQAAKKTADVFGCSIRTVFRSEEVMKKKFINENRRTRSNAR